MITVKEFKSSDDKPDEVVQTISVDYHASNGAVNRDINYIAGKLSVSNSTLILTPFDAADLSQRLIKSTAHWCSPLYAWAKRKTAASRGE